MPAKFDRDDVDLAVLGEELEARLGHPVALSARPPGQLDEDGEPLEGALIVLDPATGEELDVDFTEVEEAVAAHTPPPSAVELREQVLAKAEGKAANGDTKGALADLFALLREETPAAPPAPPTPTPPSPAPPTPPR